MKPKSVDYFNFTTASLPAIFLALLIIWGLILRPLLLEQTAIPLELIFIWAASFAIGQLFLLGFSWNEIQSAVINRLAIALPAIFILLLIGPLVAAWMISGTIPMLVSWGIEFINPRYLYLFCFLLSAIFSTLTGTSWGSTATIGVVMISIASSLGENTAIAAGAIIGGAYFGDKLSPLSDTTNITAIATGVDIFTHIKAMLWTTVPSAIIAVTAYTLVGTETNFGYSAEGSSDLMAFQTSLSEYFDYNLYLLLPILIVLLGSLKRWPIIPLILLSTFIATALAALIQDFSFFAVVNSLVSGISLEQHNDLSATDPVRLLLERGGLYSMKEAVTIALLVFIFIGAIDLLNTMPRIVERLFSFTKGPKTTILASLIASALTNAMTSNQSATAFIVGDAFYRRYDNLNVPRKVLSRSIEDTGTMIESIIPWHATALFMVATLGVPVQEYWPWQFLTLANLFIAPLITILGIGYARK